MTDREARFWVKVDRFAVSRRPDLGPCWTWSAARRKSGHGAFDNTSAHRASWVIANGPIPDGLWVLHRCDNPPCVNVDHLFLGTHEDNMRDMVQKDRSLIGARCRQSKLAEQDVIDILSRVGKETRAQLAREYGVAEATIRNIVSGIAWRTIPRPTTGIAPTLEVAAKLLRRCRFAPSVRSQENLAKEIEAFLASYDFTRLEVANG